MFALGLKVEISCCCFWFRLNLFRTNLATQSIILFQIRFGRERVKISYAERILDSINGQLEKGKFSLYACIESPVLKSRASTLAQWLKKDVY